jgi:hypothetical protein
MKLHQAYRWGQQHAGALGAAASVAGSVAADHFSKRSASMTGKRTRAGAPYEYRRKYRRLGPKYGPMRSIIKKDGVSYSVRTKGNGRRKKKSLRKKVNSLIRNQPKYSIKTFRNFKTMVMPHNADNEHRIHSIDVFRANDMEGWIQNLTQVDAAAAADYRAENTAVKMDIFYKITIRNNSLSNCDMKYVFINCIDTNDNFPIHWVKEDLQDRGYTVPALSGITGATATSSEVPNRIIFNASNPWHVSTMSGVEFDRKWKKVGKIKSVTLGPGDVINLYYKRKNLVYKPEIFDKTPRRYLKHQSACLLIDTRGQLGHDQTNHDLVGYGRVHLDCEQKLIARVKYYNPKGLREEVYTDTLDSTNVTLIEHADNHAGAIEAGEK